MGLWMPWPASAWPAPQPLQSPKPPKQLPPLLPALGRHPQPKNHCRRYFQGLEVQQQPPPGFRLLLPARRRKHATPAWVWVNRQSEVLASAGSGRAERRPSPRSNVWFMWTTNGLECQQLVIHVETFKLFCLFICLWQNNGHSETIPV